MSLDFYLKNPEKTKKTCYHCNSEYEEQEEIYSRNITHNLWAMASEAGIYEALWHPDRIWVTKANELIEILRKWLKELKENEPRFRKFDSPNGWWTYENFIPFVASVLNACENNPEALVFTST